MTLWDITADCTWARFKNNSTRNLIVLEPWHRISQYMKKNPGREPRSFQLGKHGCVALMALVLAVVGCGKKQPPQAAAPPAPAAGNQNAPATPASQPTHTEPPQLAAPAGNDLQAKSIHQMEKVLVGWVISHHHRPKSFEEFVAESRIQVPSPPPGKKYVIANNMHILLVDK